MNKTRCPAPLIGAGHFMYAGDISYYRRNGATVIGYVKAIQKKTYNSAGGVRGGGLRLRPQGCRFDVG